MPRKRVDPLKQARKTVARRMRMHYTISSFIAGYDNARIDVFWYRRRGLVANNKWYFSTHTPTFLVLGIRGAGKSSWLEALAEYYLGKDIGNVIDLFGSRDGEGLAWLRSEILPALQARRKKPVVALIHGKNVEVDASKVEDLYDIRIELLPYSDISLGVLEEYPLVISASPLYSSLDEEYLAVNQVIQELYTRFTWKRPIFLLVREAAQLYYSRLRISKSQTEAKAGTVYLVREARHMGIALGLDTGKYTAIESEIRMLSDYLVFKRMGFTMLPNDLRWIYSLINPEALDTLPKYAFIIVSSNGSLGIGINTSPRWHKKQGENILKEIPLVIRQR